MITEMTGMLASSRTGHDKLMVYVIIKEETEYVYLVDGKSRTLARPKKKNKKHIQVIKKCQEPDLAEKIRTGAIDDIGIRKIIKQYQADRNR
ncbi:MAG: KOW domain-containing RNA-binding protein [Blautia sp.]|nr:KOW domain-containing RNA-binding protein [Lachnoclostridium sp.]MCM1210037.1 KOW domain-containing RNA-binding protein [Blautia sp.]